MRWLPLFAAGILLLSSTTGGIYQAPGRRGLTPLELEFLTDALGRGHVRSHFPSVVELKGAVEHAKETSSSTNLVGCTTYNDHGLALVGKLSSAGIPTHVTYSSAAEHSLCFMSFASLSNPTDLAVLESVQPLLKLTTTALPTVLKLDASLIRTLDWAGENQPQIVGDPTDDPIINDIAEGKNVSLSIIFRDDWHMKSGGAGGLTRKKAVVKSWLRVLAGDNLRDLEAVWDRFYWTRPKSQQQQQPTSKFDFEEEKDKDDDLDRVKLRLEFWQRWRTHASARTRKLSSSAAAADLSCPDIIKLTPTKTTAATASIEFDLTVEAFSAAGVDCLALFVATVASHAAVSRIALSRPMRLLNNYARGIVQSGRVNSEPYSLVGLDGTGQIIGIADTGIDENSCFFRDDVNGFVPLSSPDNPRTFPNQRKIVQYLNYSGSGGDLPDGHGSHVAGSVAGNCIGNPDKADMKDFNGMAPGAKIAFFDIMDDTTDKLYVPSDLAKVMFRSAYSGGARLYSNSWGGSYWYDAFAMEVDDFSYKNPDFLAIFAAGNDGSRGMRSVLSPAMAKNAVAVAASNTGHTSSSGDILLEIPAFSAKGPAPDGRIKPDITVPGASIFSTRAAKSTTKSQTCAVEPKTGTSMAAPVCAGNAALIRQYFADPLFWSAVCNTSYPLCKQGAFSPPGYLVKAVLLSTGTDLKYYLNAKNSKVSLPGTPDFFQGYGRVNLGYALPLGPYIYQLSGFDLFVDTSRVESYTEMVYEVHVLESIVPLRATLCWYDPPNQEFVARVLLHDLDLVLVDPSGAIFFGNQVHGGAHRRDELNANEQVTISAPTVGKWLVKVQGKLLSETSMQAFAVAITHAGYVVAPSTAGSINKLQRLDPYSFEDCTKSLLPKSEKNSTLVGIELSLWSLVTSKGWDARQRYTISPSGLGSGIAISGTFAHNATYSVVKHCLFTGCYDFSVDFGNGLREGTLMSLPICGDWLFTPLSPRQTLCFSAVDDGLGYRDVVCQRGISKESAGNTTEIRVVLVEDAGAGWNGGFYTVLPYPLSSSPSLDPATLMESAATDSGTMDWAFESAVTLRLPQKQPCHMIKLTLPRGVEAQPMIVFENASLLVSQSDRSYALNSKSRPLPCPFYLNMTNAFAEICTCADSPGHGPVDISFYHARGNETLALRVGAQPTLWQEYLWATAKDNLTYIGICRQQLDGNITTIPIGATGSTGPTLAPIIRRAPPPPPTLFYPEGYNFACFQDCPGFPRSPYSAQQACQFLVSVAYPLCGSVSIATAACHKLPCASRCSVEEWCFFGSATIGSCLISPGGVTVDAPFRLSNSAINTNSQCILVSTSQSQGNGSSAAVPTESIVATEASLGPAIIATLVLAQMFLICCALQWLRRPTCRLSDLLQPDFFQSPQSTRGEHIVLPNESSHEGSPTGVRNPLSGQPPPSSFSITTEDEGDEEQ